MLGAETTTMEHRWGERFRIQIPVRLLVCSLGVVHGWSEDVSLSGVFVSTGARIHTGVAVHVELDLPHSRRLNPHRIPAYAVRPTERGVGLEWSEFAPRAIRALFAASRTPTLVRIPARPADLFQHGYPSTIPAGDARSASRT